MRYEIRELSISEPERLWLNEVYSGFKKGEQLNIRKLKSVLWGKIPPDFDPMAIDSRLLMHGTEITLLGISHVNPQTDLIEKTDHIIRTTRELLLQDTERKIVTADEIAELAKIPVEDVGVIFRQIGLLGPFWYSCRPGLKGGYSEIQIEEGKNFDAFYRYEGIESLLNRFSNERKATERQATALPEYAGIEAPDYTWDVFLSYSSQDLQEANSTYEAIQEAGGKVFLAEKSLKPGDEFDERIRVSLVQSRELWLLVTPDSLKSEWVLTELGAAWALQKKIVPILYRCRPEDLPDLIRRKQCIDFHRCSELIESTFD